MSIGVFRSLRVSARQKGSRSNKKYRALSPESHPGSTTRNNRHPTALHRPCTDQWPILCWRAPMPPSSKQNGFASP
ncbi:hypothetical protein ABH999_000148 [Bradyrhizobium yuanmingense]